jgi:probable rRNA maturation factor
MTASSAGQRPHLDICVRAGADRPRRISRTRLRRAWRAVMATHATAPRRVSLALVGDAEMGRIHLDFSAIAGTTDVLSFDFRTNAEVGSELVEAEVVVCVDVALREARRRGLALEDELDLYFIHGLLHTCGFDDQTAPQRRAMRQQERAIRAALARDRH